MTIYALGNCLFDQTAYVPMDFIERHSLPYGKTKVSDEAEAAGLWHDAGAPADTPMTVGGSSANTAKVLALLGHDTTLAVGKVGADGSGDTFTARLNGVGVNTLLNRGAGGTGLVRCFVTPDGQRTMVAVLRATATLTAEEVPASFPQARHVHIEAFLSFFPGVIERCLDNAAGVPVSLNLSDVDVVRLFGEGLKSVARRVHYVFGNEQEMCALTGQSSPAAAAAWFAVRQIAVVTVGAQGCWVKARNEGTAQHYPAPPLEQLVDSTGAGDSFIAGFLHGLFTDNNNIARAATIGHIAAAVVIGQRGTDLTAQQAAELQRRVAVLDGVSTR